MVLKIMKRITVLLKINGLFKTRVSNCLLVTEAAGDTEALPLKPTTWPGGEAAGWRAPLGQRGGHRGPWTRDLSFQAAV